MTWTEFGVEYAITFIVVITFVLGVFVGALAVMRPDDQAARRAEKEEEE